jgi:hypothetical protein
MKRFSLQFVRVLWRRVWGDIEAWFGWRDAPEWQPPAAPVPDELEQFAVRAMEMREAAVHRMFTQLSAAAGGPCGGVRLVARITGTNAAAVELLTPRSAGVPAPQQGCDDAARRDIIDFVRDRAAVHSRGCATSRRVGKSRVTGE